MNKNVKTSRMKYHRVMVRLSKWATHGFLSLLLPISFTACSDKRDTASKDKLPGQYPQKLGIYPIKELTAALKQDIPRLQQQYKVPGVSVAMIDNAEIIWAEGFGVLNTEQGGQVTPDSVMEVASLSKPFFAYMVLKWAEQSRIDLDKPLTFYIEEDYIPADIRDERITARMVLNHSTGLPNWRRGGSNNIHGWSGEVGFELSSGNPIQFLFEPGSQYGYSGEGFVMLQRALEKQTGLALSEWADKQLITPLGLKTTYFGWQQHFDDIAAYGHNKNGELTDRSENRASDTRPRFATAAASLYSSANDYARFLIEIMQHDRSQEHALSQSTIDQMLSPSITKTDKQQSFMGLGWHLVDIDGDRLVFHTGNNGDFHCVAAFWPKYKDGLVILTNAAGGASLLEAVDSIFDTL